MGKERPGRKAAIQAKERIHQLSSNSRNTKEGNKQEKVTSERLEELLGEGREQGLKELLGDNHSEVITELKGLRKCFAHALRYLHQIANYSPKTISLGAVSPPLPWQTSRSHSRSRTRTRSPFTPQPSTSGTQRPIATVPIETKQEEEE
jgi:hypothetical protein